MTDKNIAGLTNPIAAMLREKSYAPDDWAARAADEIERLERELEIAKLNAKQSNEACEKMHPLYQEALRARLADEPSGQRSSCGATLEGYDNLRCKLAAGHADEHIFRVVIE